MATVKVVNTRKKRNQYQNLFCESAAYWERRQKYLGSRFLGDLKVFSSISAPSDSIRFGVACCIDKKPSKGFLKNNPIRL